ncbi:MAG: bifunctional ADP-heptose synthase [Bacteroidales bacterium]|jgi:rfaE bifunctional protein kinase chain/domain|nr:bifunctional ADP-heptose synthase [Bacteroidales bacterium]
MITTDTISRLFSGFNNLSALIIGDVMVDAYLWGKVERISPEAPVPIVSVHKRENRLGGAANVGLNIKSLGAEAYLCAVIGNDQKGTEFLELLDNEGISKQGIVLSDHRVTTTKFRVIGNNAQMIRVDEENTKPLNNIEAEDLLSKISKLLELEEINVVIFQDYDKGVISRELINDIVSLATAKNIPVVVDPKKEHFLDFKNVSLFKPNLKEIKEGLKIDFDENDPVALEKAISSLQKSVNAQVVLNTLSDKGMIVRWQEDGRFKSEKFPAHYRNISDVSGAGDTVISVAALCLASGIEVPDMAAIANLAGGIVCEEVGVVPINKTKLQDEVIRMLSK